MNFKNKQKHFINIRFKRNPKFLTFKEIGKCTKKNL
jgi:hypothetical protein